jgi:hypothetical protein
VKDLNEWLDFWNRDWSKVSTSKMAQQIADEIDREILKELLELGGGNHSGSLVSHTNDQSSNPQFRRCIYGVWDPNDENRNKKD